MLAVSVLLSAVVLFESVGVGGSEFEGETAGVSFPPLLFDGSRKASAEIDGDNTEAEGLVAFTVPLAGEVVFERVFVGCAALVTLGLLVRLLKVVLFESDGEGSRLCETDGGAVALSPNAPFGLLEFEIEGEWVLFMANPSLLSPDGEVVLEWVRDGMPSPVTLGLSVLLSKVVLLVRDGVGSVLPDELGPSDEV